MLNVRPGYAYVERGGLLGSQALYAEALAEYTQAIVVDPTYIEAYTDRGMTYFKLGQYPQALDDYNHAIAIGARFRVYGRRAGVYLALGQYRQALADFDQFLKELEERRLTEMVSDALIGRSRAYRGLGDYRRALADVTRALSLTDARFLLQRAYYYRGEVYLAQRKYQEALTDFDSALAIEPQFDDTDSRIQQEAALKDLPTLRETAYSLSTSSAAGDAGAARAGWLGRLLGRGGR